MALRGQVVNPVEQIINEAARQARTNVRGPYVGAVAVSTGVGAVAKDRTFEIEDEDGNMQTGHYAIYNVDSYNDPAAIYYDGE